MSTALNTLQELLAKVGVPAEEIAALGDDEAGMAQRLRAETAYRFTLEAFRRRQRGTIARADPIAHRVLRRFGTANAIRSGGYDVFASAPERYAALFIDRYLDEIRAREATGAATEPPPKSQFDELIDEMLARAVGQRA